MGISCHVHGLFGNGDSQWLGDLIGFSVRWTGEGWIGPNKFPGPCGEVSAVRYNPASWEANAGSVIIRTCLISFPRERVRVRVYTLAAASAEGGLNPVTSTYPDAPDSDQDGGVAAERTNRPSKQVGPALKAVSCASARPDLPASSNGRTPPFEGVNRGSSP